MYSDDWHRAGYRIEKPIPILAPVYYRHAFDLKGNIVGVIVDYEFADDFHYELLAEDWEKFRRNYLSDLDEDETSAFRIFISRHNLNSFEGKFAFENALKSSDVKYKKIAFY